MHRTRRGPRDDRAGGRPRDPRALGRPGLGWLVDVPASTLMAPSAMICARTTGRSTVDVAAALEAANNPDPRIVGATRMPCWPRPGGYARRRRGCERACWTWTSTARPRPARCFPRPGRDAQPTRCRRRSRSAPTARTTSASSPAFRNPLRPPAMRRSTASSPGEAPQVFCSGFNGIIDIAFDGDGNLYVLQYSAEPTPCRRGDPLPRRPDSPRTRPDRSCPERRAGRTREWYWISRRRSPSAPVARCTLTTGWRSRRACGARSCASNREQREL